MGGWIKLHRSLLDWEWWDDRSTTRIWLTILLSVNHEPKRWHGIDIKAGEMVTSYARLAEKSGLSVRAVRTALEHLKSTQNVTCKPTKHYTIISVVKWADFQGIDIMTDTPTDTQLTNKRHTTDKQPTTNKNEKNDKNIRNIFICPTLDEVTAYCRQRHNKVDPQTFIDFYESKGWMVGKNKMKDWKACIRTWEKSDVKCFGRKSGHVVIEPPDYIKEPVNWDEEELPF